MQVSRPLSLQVPRSRFFPACCWFALRVGSLPGRPAGQGQAWRSWCVTWAPVAGINAEHKRTHHQGARALSFVEACMQARLQIAPHCSWCLRVLRRSRMRVLPVGRHRSGSACVQERSSSAGAWPASVIGAGWRIWRKTLRQIPGAQRKRAAIFRWPPVLYRACAITRSRPACRPDAPSHRPPCTRTRRRRLACSTVRRSRGSSPVHAGRSSGARPVLPG